MRNAFDQVVALAKDGRWKEAAALLAAQPSLALQTDEVGFSLLMRLASIPGARPLLGQLIEQGAEVNRVSPTGETSLAMTIEGGSTFGLSTLDELTLLLEKGADCNAEAICGFPPLHWAIYKGRLEHARVLLEHGADPNRRSLDGETATDVARRMRSTRGENFLLHWRKPRDTQ